MKYLYLFILQLSLLSGLQAATGAPPFPTYPSPVRFPDDAQITDITKAPYNAVGDGKTDCTAAIQQALNDKKRLIYFPKGTYVIRNTLRWAMSSKNTTSRQVFQGESMEGSIIKLADSCPGFQDPTQPRELIWTGKFPPQSFRNGLRNLTIDTGTGNPGVIGARFYANNQGAMHDVTIRSGDGKGVIGLDLGYTGDQGPCLIRKVKIVGFDTGVSFAFGSAGVVIEYMELEKQNKYGLNNINHPVTIRGLVSKNSVPAIKNSGNTLLTIVDSTLEGIGPEASTLPAIQNSTGLFTRNLVTKGYKEAIGGTSGGQAGPDIEEWVSHPAYSLFPSPPRSLDLPVKETPEPSWDDPKTWVNAVQHGPTIVEVLDGKGRKQKINSYHESFQKVIDSGAETIYFPNGSWAMHGEVRIRGKVKHIIGLESGLDGKNTHTTWTVEGGSAPLIRLERMEAMYSNFTIEHRSKQTLVLSSMIGGHGAIIKQKGSGDLFLEDYCAGVWKFYGGNVWARQFNPEAGYGPPPEVPRGTYSDTYDKVLSESTTLWVLGLKTEGDGTQVTALNGSKTEIVGGFIYANKAYRPEKQWFVNENSSLSFSLVEQVIRKAPFDPVFEIRDGVTRIMKKGVAPERTGGSLIPLYTGYVGPGTLPPSPPGSLQANAESSTRVKLTWKATGEQDGFVVEYRASGGEWQQDACTLAYELTVEKLKPDTAYEFRISAFSGNQLAVSPIVTVKTAAPPGPGNGTGLRAEIYGGRSFSGTPAIETHPVVDFDWNQTGPAGKTPGRVSVRWTGQIEPRFSEETAFFVEQDGMRLWVGDTLVIDAKPGTRTRRGAVILESGIKKNIKLEYFPEKPGKAQLSWESENLPREIVPTTQLYPAAESLPALTLKGQDNIKEGDPITVSIERVPGTNSTPLAFPVVLGGNAVRDADYTLEEEELALNPNAKSLDFTIKTIDDKVGEPNKTLVLDIAQSPDYNVNSAPLTVLIADNDMPAPGQGTGIKGEYFGTLDFTDLKHTRVDKSVDFSWDKKAPAPGMPTAKYSIRWSGELVPLFNENYTFTVPSTKYGKVKLLLNGKTLIESEGGKGEKTANVNLEAGKKIPLVLEYINARDYGSNVKLMWSSPSQFEQPIPATQLYSNP